MRTALKKDEKLALLIRPHWFTLVWPGVFVVITFIPAVFIGTVAFIVPFILLCFFGYKIIERRNNLWAVTNLRVIDEYGVFSLNSKESPLDKINNVSYNQSIWGRIFGYGNVQIQTAAEIGSTSYQMVERPRELKDTITRMQEEYKNFQILSQARELAKAMSTGTHKPSGTEVAAELEKLYELKQRGILTEEEFLARKKKILDS
jgi:uncharacterized membrane protein YdbT with pleckstrin-like domain